MRPLALALLVLLTPASTLAQASSASRTLARWSRERPAPAPRFHDLSFFPGRFACRLPAGPSVPNRPENWEQIRREASRCFEDARAGERFVLRMTLAPDGTVRTVTPTEVHARRGLAECTARVFMRARFGPLLRAQRDVDVAMPFVVAPRPTESPAAPSPEPTAPEPTAPNPEAHHDDARRSRPRRR